MGKNAHRDKSDSWLTSTASAHSWVVWASWRDRYWFDISLLEFVCVSLLVV
jgi:hypothetical protein